MADWRRDAACRSVDTALFFPGSATARQTKQAKRICAACPVRDECLTYALTAPEKYGIWGGLTADERDRKRRRKRRARKEAIAS